MSEEQAGDGGWRVIDASPFGSSVLIDGFADRGCDMMLVCADLHSHVPQFILLPHQAYAENLLKLAANTGARSLTIMPYRNADKVRVDVRDLADALEIAKRERAMKSRFRHPHSHGEG